MGFDGKTPKPGDPGNNGKKHKHSFYDYNQQLWKEVNCTCATGRYHKTPRDPRR